MLVPWRVAPVVSDLPTPVLSFPLRSVDCISFNCLAHWRRCQFALLYLYQGVISHKIQVLIWLFRFRDFWNFHYICLYYHSLKDYRKKRNLLFSTIFYLHISKNNQLPTCKLQLSEKKTPNPPEVGGKKTLPKSRVNQNNKAKARMPCLLLLSGSTNRPSIRYRRVGLLGRCGSVEPSWNHKTLGTTTRFCAVGQWWTSSISTRIRKKMILLHLLNQTQPYLRKSIHIHSERVAQSSYLLFLTWRDSFGRPGRFSLCFFLPLHILSQNLYHGTWKWWFP